jgi:hypothetical protein
MKLVRAFRACPKNCRGDYKQRVFSLKGQFSKGKNFLGEFNMIESFLPLRARLWLLINKNQRAVRREPHASVEGEERSPAGRRAKCQRQKHHERTPAAGLEFPDRSRTAAAKENRANI